MHKTADGYEICVGDALWDNDLSLVRIIKIADWAETALEPAWHKTQVLRRYDGTPGHGRTNHSDGSRLARRHPVDGTDAAEAARTLTLEELEDLGVSHEW